jgi:hypothetical protein
VARAHSAGYRIGLRIYDRNLRSPYSFVGVVNSRTVISFVSRVPCRILRDRNQSTEYHVFLPNQIVQVPPLCVGMWKPPAGHGILDSDALVMLAGRTKDEEVEF